MLTDGQTDGPTEVGIAIALCHIDRLGYKPLGHVVLRPKVGVSNSKYLIKRESQTIFSESDMITTLTSQRRLHMKVHQTFTWIQLSTKNELQQIRMSF